MKKIIIIILGLVWVMSSAQVKKIDSIYQEKWKASQINIDSIANLPISGIEIKVKDTIILKPNKIIAELNTEVPITPFQLINYKEEKKWFFFGQNQLVFNQASFSNWNSGGNNNIGILGKINYNLSYKKRKHYLENNFLLGYGLVASSGQATRKTEDFINVLSNYGYELGKNYYLSAGFQFLSQFSPGYNYSTSVAPEFNDRISRFLAPAYFNVGLGLSYNPNENFQIIFRPINGKFTLVNDPFLQKKGRYGLEFDGQKLRKELGAMLNVLYRIKVYKDINLVNQVNFFSNYLYHTERVDFSYNGLLNFRLNKMISTNISIDMLYDHDQIQKLQLKQTLGIGFVYQLGVEHQEQSKIRNIKPFIVK